MRLHWKKGPTMHKDGHHHLKRKHMMLRSMFKADDLLCKKKHFKHMMKGRSMLSPGFHGKWKHFKGMRGHSSSDSDDSHHHHGKGMHFKGYSMLAPGHHGKMKHFQGMRGSSSDSDDSHHHRGKGKRFKRMMKGYSLLAQGHHGKMKHFKGMRGHSSSDSDDSDHGRGKHGCVPGTERSHHHGKEKHVKEIQDRSMSFPDAERMQRRCMSDNEGGHHHGRMHFMGRRGRPFNDSEGHHGKEKHSKDLPGRSMSCSDDEGMQGCFMSDNEGGHHHGRMHFMRRRGRPMNDSEGHEGMQRRFLSDNEGGHHHGGMHFMGRRGRPMNDSEGHRGKENHSKFMQDMSYPDDEVMQRRCLSDNEGGHHHGRMHFMGRQGRPMTDHDGHHGKGKHMRGMMHHHKGKHWMRGHGRRGFFDDDSALVPICTPDANGCPEILENENTGNQATEAAEMVDEDTTRTKNQETQTSGIMEIVIEDQEALSAAIRIVNKFL